MNYQYRHGTAFTAATRTLYTEGGIRRYYQGIAPALIQGSCIAFLSGLGMLTSSLHRTRRQIRRHSRKRGYPCITSLQSIPEELTITSQDHLCISLVSELQAHEQSDSM